MQETTYTPLEARALGFVGKGTVVEILPFSEHVIGKAYECTDMQTRNMIKKKEIQPNLRETAVVPALGELVEVRSGFVRREISKEDPLLQHVSNIERKHRTSLESQ